MLFDHNPSAEPELPLLALLPGGLADCVGATCPVVGRKLCNACQLYADEAEDMAAQSHVTENVQLVVQHRLSHQRKQTRGKCCWPNGRKKISRTYQCDDPTS
jgi:hypothetical protein